MKKLLLLPLVAIGLALVPTKQADAQVSIGVGPVGIGFGYPAYRYSYYGPRYYGYYPRSDYSYYGGYPYYRTYYNTGRPYNYKGSEVLAPPQALLLPVLSTPVGVRPNELAWSNSKPAFLFPKPNHPA
jgi:hypothetical protein